MSPSINLKKRTRRLPLRVEWAWREMWERRNALEWLSRQGLRTPLSREARTANWHRVWRAQQLPRKRPYLALCRREILPGFPKVRVRPGAFFAPQIEKQRIARQQGPRMSLDGTGRAGAPSDARWEWPPLPGHPVYGWRARLVAGTLLRHMRTRGLRFPWSQFGTLCDIAAGKRPFGISAWETACAFLHRMNTRPIKRTGPRHAQRVIPTFSLRVTPGQGIALRIGRDASGPSPPTPASPAAITAPSASRTRG